MAQMRDLPTQSGQIAQFHILNYKWFTCLVALRLFGREAVATAAVALGPPKFECEKSGGKNGGNGDAME